VRPIRQKSALLISKRNFGNSRSARFQRLSASIGRFFEIYRASSGRASPGKIPSASATTSPSGGWHGKREFQSLVLYVACRLANLSSGYQRLSVKLIPALTLSSTAMADHKGCGLGDPETSKYKNLHRGQHGCEDSRRGKGAGDHRGRQWPHEDPGNGKCRGDRDISH
jgi:hypothetical protein